MPVAESLFEVEDGLGNLILLGVQPAGKIPCRGIARIDDQGLAQCVRGAFLLSCSGCHKCERRVGAGQVGIERNCFFEIPQRICGVSESEIDVRQLIPGAGFVRRNLNGPVKNLCCALQLACRFQGLPERLLRLCRSRSKPNGFLLSQRCFFSAPAGQPCVSELKIPLGIARMLLFENSREAGDAGV